MKSSRYGQLTTHLRTMGRAEIPMTFKEMEEVLGFKLPPRASTHRAWFSNNPTNNPMTAAWLAAGYKSANVDMKNRKLVFRRVAPEERCPESDRPTPTAAELREIAASMPTAAELRGIAASMLTAAELREIVASMLTTAELREIAASIPTAAELREIAASIPTAAELREIAASIHGQTTAG